MWKAGESGSGDTWPEMPQELAALLDEHLDHLVRYAFRKLRNIYDAQDVVQEAMVKLFSKPMLEQNNFAIAYLYRCVDNTAIDLLRKRKRTPVSVGEDNAAASIERMNPLQEALIIEEMSRTEVLLRRLPAEQAEAIRLRVFDGLQLDEIAKALGCPIDTVSSRLRYGFKKLREIVSRTRGKGL